MIKKYPLIFLSAALLALSSALADPAPPSKESQAENISPAQPVVPDRKFTLSQFGAVSDAKTPNTEAFRDAIDAVEKAGGGTLVVPPGIYLTGPIALCSGINLHLDAGATILFSSDEKPSRDGRILPLLLAKEAHDIVISGLGTIYGSGEAWWPAVHQSMKNHGPHIPRPRMVVFDHCKRVRIEGVTLTHSPEFNLVPMYCQDVTIDGISIYNPSDDAIREVGVPKEEVLKNLQKSWDDESPNTDGIDPMVSQRVLIRNCRIDTGDDCIAIKANDGAITQDILIENCTFLHGHGCTVGSGSRGGLRHVVVRNCTFTGTEVGINLESARDRGSLIEDLAFSNITMVDVGDAIILSDYYPNGARVERSFAKPFYNALLDGAHAEPMPLTPTTPRWRNISIRNVSATCLWEAGLILGLPEMPVEDISIEHVDIKAPEGLHISYAKDITLHFVNIAATTGPSLIVSDTVTGLKE